MDQTLWPSLSPIDFFELEIPLFEIDVSNWRALLQEKEYRFPLISDLLQEDPLAISGGWSEAGLLFMIEGKDALSISCFPEFREGDSLEFFIDTRGIKEGRFLHRFCHHFYFLPEAVEGIQAAEITRFRGEDRHPLAKEEELQFYINSSSKKKKFEVFFSKEVLFGFDPAHSKKIGFALRFNRSGKEPLHFPFKSEAFKIEDAPALWATLNMVSHDST